MKAQFREEVLYFLPLTRPFHGDPATRSAMSDPYERAKGGRLTFKGGAIATRSKSIDKKHKKKKKQKKEPAEDQAGGDADIPELDGDTGGGEGEGDGEGVYTIDAAKKMKYEELFPVEARKFRYDPKFKAKSVEDALDDRVKKKADRYCK